MMQATSTGMVLDVLGLARRVADFAEREGFSNVLQRRRTPLWHLGAVLADSVLQAGVNYRTVVKPRVERILRLFPESATLTGTMKIVESGSVGDFLQWKHGEKVERFTRLYRLFAAYELEDANCLRQWLRRSSCRAELLQVKGIGPKTVDYLGCLVGIDSVAVDRHVRGFAKQAGVEVKDYDALKSVFCCAADLLGSSRRDFDAWVWTKTSQARSSREQLELF